jgi:hypothetical protein
VYVCSVCVLYSSKSVGWLCFFFVMGQWGKGRIIVKVRVVWVWAIDCAVLRPHIRLSCVCASAGLWACAVMGVCIFAFSSGVCTLCTELNVSALGTA